MININLVGKKRRSIKGRNWIITSSIVLFSIFTLYFLSVSGYIVVKLFLLNSEQTAINSATVAISREIASDNELLRGFVLSKYILGKIQTLDSEKFPYKNYLDQLVSFVPAGGVLKNVDFSNKGWVAVVVSMPGVSSVMALEEVMADTNLLSSSSFQSVFAENIIKEKTGAYTAKLQFELKKNGG